MTYVIGHKNPDSDSICSAIGYAAYKTEVTGETYIPRRAGKVNPESQFVLDRFGLEAPELLENAAGQELILVDHNEVAQAVDGLTEATIKEILDHHKIGDVQTPDPIYFRNVPVGCTATIVYMHYQEQGLTPAKEIAGVLCSGILSDTLAFRSPTCTIVDQQIAKMLAKIANIDIMEHATAMFNAGSQLDGRSPDEIFHMDYKCYNTKTKSLAVAQVTSVSQSELTLLKEKMIPYLKELLPTSGLDMLFLMLTNIIDETTDLLFVGRDSAEVVRTAFQRECQPNCVRLPGVVSRKKQMMSPLISAIEEVTEG